MFESVDPSPSGKLVDRECRETRRSKARGLGQTGQSTVEFVLVLPLVIIVLLCTLQGIRSGLHCSGGFSFNMERRFAEKSGDDRRH